MFAASKSGRAGGASTDPYFKNVSLLLETSAASTSNATATDSSAAPITVTRNGSSSTGFPSPYQTTGYWGNYFNGTANNRLTTPANTAFSYGTGDFTVEAWIYPTASPSNIGQIIGGHNSGSNADWIFALFGSASYPSTPNYIGFYGTNGGTQFFASTAVPLNQWTHVAIVVQSTVPKIYYNGVLSSTGTAGQLGSLGNASPITIGDDNTGNANSVFTGYISNLRVVKGLAVYTGTFTPSTAPLAVTQSAGINISAITGTSTSLLTCQNNRFIDNSTNNFTLTPTGTTQTTPYYYPSTFTTLTPSPGAVFFEGVSSYLSLPGSTSSLYLSGAFTWEAWVYPTATNGMIYGTWNDAASNPDGWAFWYNNAGSFPATSNTARIYWYDGNYGANECAKYSTTALPTYQWSHLVFQRDGSNVIKFFLNGVSLTLANVSVNGKSFDDTFAFNNTAPIGVGGSANGVYRYTGYIGNMRFVQSTAVYAGNFTPPTGFLTQTGGTYPSTTNVNVSITAANTKLLVNFAEANYTSATNGVQNNTFIDSSINTPTITRTGTPTQGSFTPYWPNGYWSNYFGTANTDYLSPASSASLAFGNNAYTVEFWIFMPSYTAANNRIVELGTANNSFGIQINNTATISITKYGTTDVFTSSAAFVINQWNHVAVVRTSTSANGLAVYLNGSTIGTGTDSNNWTVVTTPRINGLSGFSFGWTGYLSNLHVVNGTAVYTGAFTPQLAPLNAIANTVLLTCQSNRFKDNSTNNFAITATGTPKVQAFQPFSPAASYTAAAYGGSGYFAGGTDKLTTPTDAAFNLAGGSWTIEGYFYFLAATNYSTLVMCNLSNTDGFGLSLNNASNITYYVNGTAQITSATAISLNTWYHIAASSNGTTTTLYINGTSAGTTTTVPTSKSYPVTVGAKNNSIEYFTGYASNVRVVKGTAVYTANFTPPTAPVTAITNTSLLLNFTNAGIYDAAVQNNAITVGTSQASTTQYKWLPTSMRFNGTTDYLQLASNPALIIGTASATVEFWMYATATDSFRRIVASTNGGFTTGTFIIRYSNGNFIAGAGGGNFITSSTLPAANTWYHIAWVGFGGTAQTLYINGTSVGTASSYNLTEAIQFVGGYYTTGPAEFYSGYLQDVRVTRDIARAITLPTAAFPTR